MPATFLALRAPRRGPSGPERSQAAHLGGTPWARLGGFVGHADLVTTARTYTHVLADEADLDYLKLLA
jgi:hypothetical protein